MADSKDTLTEPVRENPVATYQVSRWDDSGPTDIFRSHDYKLAGNRTAASKQTLLYLSATASL